MISREQKVWLAVLVLLDLAISIGFLMTLPSRVPSHWNWRGEIDRYGSPLETTLVLSICVMFLPLMMAALPSSAPSGRPWNGRAPSTAASSSRSPRRWSPST